MTTQIDRMADGTSVVAGPAAYNVQDGSMSKPGVLISEGRIHACGDHPELIGYVVGKDDGKCVLYPTKEAALEAEVLRLRAAMEAVCAELAQTRSNYGEPAFNAYAALTDALKGR